MVVTMIVAIEVAVMVATTIVEADRMIVADRRVHIVDARRALIVAGRQVPTLDHPEDQDPAQEGATSFNSF